MYGVADENFGICDVRNANSLWQSDVQMTEYLPARPGGPTAARSHRGDFVARISHRARIAKKRDFLLVIALGSEETPPHPLVPLF